jgi:hypothetical protein
MVSVKEIIENDSKIAAKGDPIFGEVDAKQVSSQLLRLSGYGYYPYWQFQDAFEDMGTERAFALYVIASALDDIDPLDTRPPVGWHPSQIAALFRAQDKQRTKRILRLQEIEARHVAEGRALIREYRSLLKEWKRAKADRSFVATFKHNPSTRTIERIRYTYKRRLGSFLKKVEDEDLTNAAVRWFCNERDMVRFWCHMADVNLERVYMAAERRLLALGRCSPELHRITTELRAGREWRYEVELNPLHRYENRAWQALFNEPRPQSDKEH